MASLEVATGLSVVGASHRTASLDLRGSMALAPEQVRAVLDAASGEGVVEEAVILSTCNRTELYTLAADAGRAERYVRDLVARIKGSDLLAPGPHRYQLRDRDTVNHLFRVASSLESMMVGEVQILGQVKDAYRLAREGGSAGGHLARLLESAIRVGKRARAETAIGAGSVSVASSAVDLALKVLGTLAGKRVLVVGAGATGRLVAQHLATQGPAGITIASRSLASAREVAVEVGGDAIELGEVAAHIERVDVLVTATRSPEPLVTVPMVQEALRRRRLPLVILDLSVPRNVEAGAGSLENVFLYPVDALESLVAKNLEDRRQEIPKVEAIIAAEVDSFMRGVRARQATPVIRALRNHFEEVRTRELERHLHDLPEPERARLEAVTRAIVNKLLHDPTMAIKRAQAEPTETTLAAACDLFHLEIPGVAAAAPVAVAS